MNSRTGQIPINIVSANVWRPRLFRAAYILATAVAMFGWICAIGWVTVGLAKWLIA
jgi:hypothetical protein